MCIMQRLKFLIFSLFLLQHLHRLLFYYRTYQQNMVMVMIIIIKMLENF